MRVRTPAGNPRIRRVEIEGAGVFTIDAEDASRLGLTDLSQVDAQTAERVARVALLRSARAAALRLLDRRPRSRAEIQAALGRRVPRGIAAAVVAGLAREGWLDDAKFAQAWIRDRIALRPMGRRRIAAELRRRGVPASIVEAQLDALLPPDREEQEAQASARRRWATMRGLSPDAARRRLAGWLMRRGYSAGVVAGVLRGIDAQHDRGGGEPPDE